MVVSTVLNWKIHRFSGDTATGRMGTGWAVGRPENVGYDGWLGEPRALESQGWNVTTRLLIADDHEVIRESLRIIFLNTDIQIVAEAGTGRAAVLLAKEQELDMALVDIAMPDGDGFEVLEQMACVAPQVPVLIYSSNDREHHVRRARQLGAKGWLVKGVSESDLRGAIHLAAAGGTLWDRDANQ